MTEMTAQEPRWREESFNIQPQRMPVSFKMKPSVIAHKPRQPDLALARVPVMVRSSNQRPVEAGIGPSASQWQVSDPGQMNPNGSVPSGALPGMGGFSPSGALPGMGADVLAPAPKASVGMVILLGALAGCLAYSLTK